MYIFFENILQVINDNYYKLCIFLLTELHIFKNFPCKAKQFSKMDNL